MCPKRQTLRFQTFWPILYTLPQQQKPGKPLSVTQTPLPMSQTQHPLGSLPTLCTRLWWWGLQGRSQLTQCPLIITLLHSGPFSPGGGGETHADGHRGEGRVGGDSRQRQVAGGGHLLGLFRGERLLGGPGGASVAALRRAGPPRHLGMLPDAWRPATLRAGGEVGDRRRPVVPVVVVGLRFPERRDLTGEA